jgi:hypothetical protein
MASTQPGPGPLLQPVNLAFSSQLVPVAVKSPCGLQQNGARLQQALGTLPSLSPAAGGPIASGFYPSEMDPLLCGAPSRPASAPPDPASSEEVNVLSPRKRSKVWGWWHRWQCPE